MTGSRHQEPVQVLRVIARLNMGGPALHVSYLAKGLQLLGYRTTLVAGTLARGESSMTFVASELGVPIHTIPELSRELSALYDPVAVWRLIRLIRALRPQIVHTHTAKAGAIGRMAAALSGLQPPPIVVHTFHGHVLRGYFDPVRTAAFQLIEQGLARKTDILVAVSPHVRDELVDLGVGPRSQFEVIRLGIDLERRLATDESAFELRRLFGIPITRFVVGWVGRMTAVKRTNDLPSILARLRGRGVEAVLCLVGDGPDREQAEETAHRLGVGRHCLFVGYQRDVGAYYRMFDALLLTSINQGTPVSVIESLAAGRPVVATRVGGVPDVVRHGIDGFLVPAHDVDAAADHLALLASDHDLRLRMGASGQERIAERYAVDRLVSGGDALYRRVLAERGWALPEARAP